MKIRIDSHSHIRDPYLLMQALKLLTDDIAYLRGSYPNFDEWFFHKVVPGVISGERSIFIEQRNSSIAGILILKHTLEEKKLCTLRVRPGYESLGLGVRLFETAFEVLGTEKPLLSVSEETHPKFARLFDHFNFTQHETYLGKYLPLRKEFAFNGVLETRQTSLEQMLKTGLPFVPANSSNAVHKSKKINAESFEFA